MSEEQKNQTATAAAAAQAGQYPQNIYPTRAQMRHERRMAKQAAQEEHRIARDERRAAHAARPRRDWSFEVRAGEKLYTFHWRWQPLGFEGQVTEAAPVDAQPVVEPEAGNPTQEPFGE